MFGFPQFSDQYIMLKTVQLICFAILFLGFINVSTAQERQPSEVFLLLMNGSDFKKEQALRYIRKNWDEQFEIYAVDVLYFSKDIKVYQELYPILEHQTGQDFGFDFNQWFAYIWNKPETYTADYFDFKAALLKRIDPKFERYFKDRSQQSDIRLDEVLWGGVKQDGIPPLRDPKMISADRASYLNDADVVFGISINGDTRAYPKRILAWHEMFVDTVGGVSVAGVYCTLCGTVILYKTDHLGIHYKLGTSGFLYRSNKLMYDADTQSLWNTLWGKPVIGPLVGKGIELEYLSVVTSTWGDWKLRHPDTKVLSLNTGHTRDYREGIAYQDYFSTDELMFNVPSLDDRLPNKAEVLVIRQPSASEKTIAIASSFLKKTPIYKGVIGSSEFTVFTDTSGAHRVFFTNGQNFTDFDGNKTVRDENGKIWILNENQLKQKNGSQSLERLHSFNAFWFGLKAAYPEAELIK